MSRAIASESRVVTWYRSRIGEPVTDDEVYGYWAFSFGILLALLGIVLFLVTTAMERPPVSESRAAFWNLRAVGYVFAAVGLPVALVGAIIRMPLRHRATQAGYLGVGLCVLAAVWFVLVFPEGWVTQGSGDAANIIGLYALGLTVLSIGGVLVPLLSGASESDGRPQQSMEGEQDETRGASEYVSQARFELFEDRSGEWRWRLRHRNGNVIADSGEGYSSRSNAQQGLNSVRRNAPGAAQLQLESADEPAGPVDGVDAAVAPLGEYESQATFELYEDRGGEWRWRLRHDNGNIIADSGEGYSSDRRARQGLRSVRRNAPGADYLHIDPTGFEVYEDAAGEWRWRFVHRNGQILGDSGEGYPTRAESRTAITSVVEAVGKDDSFDVYEDRGGEWRWRLLAGGEIVADSGEGYADKSGVHKAVSRVKKYAPEADILAIDPASFEVYEDRGGEWRWRLRHLNGNIIADSGEGYSSRSAARNGVDSVKRNAPGATETSA